MAQHFNYWQWVPYLLALVANTALSFTPGSMNLQTFQ